MDDARDRDTGRLALAVGAVAAGSAACLATFFAVGQPFGTINDIGNATAAVLSGGLAWRLRGQVEEPGGGCRRRRRAGRRRDLGRRLGPRRLRHDGLLPRRARVELRLRRHRRVAHRREPERRRRRSRGRARFDESGLSPVRSWSPESSRCRGSRSGSTTWRRRRRGSGSASSAGSGCTSSTRPGRSGWGSSRRGDLPGQPVAPTGSAAAE